MPSFDIVSEIDMQNFDNAVNSAKKELLNRYDFKGSNTELDLDKKEKKIDLTTEDEMKVTAIEDILLQRLVKQHIDARCIDWSGEPYASGKTMKKSLKIKEGIDKETAKKIVRAIKDQKMKVEPSIADDKVRVSAKKIDDLQATMQYLRSQDFGIALQFGNMK